MLEINFLIHSLEKEKNVIAEAELLKDEKIIECVPNFSEGQNQDCLNKIKHSIEGVQNVKLLHIDSGYSANRSVFTFAGTPAAVMEAAFQSIKSASECIDMRLQKGIHPRIGATDVCPIIPVRNVDMQECIELSFLLGERVNRELEIPVYLYEESASRDYRKNLANIRQGEYEGLEKKMQQEIWKPDFGDTYNAKCGASIIGARNFLIAYNISLYSENLEIAKTIASNIREKGSLLRDENAKPRKNNKGENIYIPGKFKNLKAIGWYVEEFQSVQVSMNIIDYQKAPIHLIYEEVKKQATEFGVEVRGSELIGLMPSKALEMAGAFYLKDENASIQQKYEAAIKELGLSHLHYFDVRNRIIEELI